MNNPCVLVLGLVTIWFGCGGGEQGPLAVTPPGEDETPSIQAPGTPAAPSIQAPGTPAAPSIQAPLPPEVSKTARACDPELAALSEVRGLNHGDTYAIQMEQSYFAEVPILGSLLYSLKSVRLATFARSPSGWTLRVRTCALSLSAPTEIVRTVFPDAFVRALPEQVRPVRFARLAAGVGFCAPRQLEIRGAALADPEGDALPQSADDARLVDLDGDGRPGVTVRVSGLVNGEVYVVQKDWFQLEGEIEEAEPGTRPTLSGTVAWQTEQVVLGADNPILDRQQLTTPDPEPGNNRFTLVPVAAGSTCANLPPAS